MIKMIKLSHIKKIILLSIITIIFILIQTSSVYAVSEAAVLFLLISPSPQANAMGETYGNIASVDPMASVNNPAFLGFYFQKHNFGFSYTKAGWLPGLVDDMYYSCYSMNFGYSIKNIPMSFGFGYHRIFLDLGEQVWKDECGERFDTFNSWDKANILSVSILLDYYIHASIGFNYKFIESMLAPDWIDVGEEKGNGKGSVNAHDFGIVIQVPIFKILSKILNNSSYVLPKFKPYLKSGFSYCLANIGDKIKYSNATQADPLPRSVYTGISINTGLKFFLNEKAFNLISFKWAREANDLLVERYMDNEGISQSRYLSGFNDIDFIDNIIFGKANSDIITNKGWELSMGDIFFIREGYYEDIEGRVIFDTNGFGINFIQPICFLLELTNQKIENEFLDKVVHNVDIEYHHSEYNCKPGHPLSDTDFDGVTLRLRTLF